jgi:hypothetical protein
METVDKATETQRRPPGDAASKARPGHSGEGSHSAMEQLIQQRSRHEAQQPRDDRRDGGPPVARKA